MFTLENKYTIEMLLGQLFNWPNRMKQQTKYKEPFWIE